MQCLLELIEDVCMIGSEKNVEKHLAECFADSQRIFELAVIIEDAFSKLGKSHSYFFN